MASAGEEDISAPVATEPVTATVPVEAKEADANPETGSEEVANQEPVEEPAE